MAQIICHSLLFTLGLFILIVSSDWLIQGGVKFSYIFKLTPLFIGLIIVAFGASMPEGSVGLVAAVKNHKYIALGNIVGSNIANISLILGLCALIRPLEVNKQIFKRELSIMVLSSLLLYVLSLDLLISRGDGVIFLTAFTIFFFLSYRDAKRSSGEEQEVGDFKFKKLVENTTSRALISGIVAASLMGIVVGANFMVRGGASLAKTFGVSPWVIGVTVFAVGTSLPELAASLSASFRNLPSISVGNVVGSNIFNVLFFMGIISLVRPINLEPRMLKFELPVLLLFSVMLFVLMRTRYKLSRAEGLLMVLGYAAFIVVLVR